VFWPRPTGEGTEEHEDARRKQARSSCFRGNVDPRILLALRRLTPTHGGCPARRSARRDGFPRFARSLVLATWTRWRMQFDSRKDRPVPRKTGLGADRVGGLAWRERADTPGFDRGGGRLRRRGRWMPGLQHLTGLCRSWVPVGMAMPDCRADRQARQPVVLVGAGKAKVVAVTFIYSRLCRLPD